MAKSEPLQNQNAGWGPWVKGTASALILFHFLALAGLVFATETGPWVVPDGIGTAHSPFFATRIFNQTDSYRTSLGLTEDYRFATNVIAESESRVELRAKDESGKVIKTFRFPDPDAWPAERHRQKLLANIAAEYDIVDPPEGEKIPAPGQKPELKSYWLRSADGATATLKWVPEHLLPRTAETVAPKPYALVLVDSLRRRAKAVSGAIKVDVVLIRKPTFGPVVVMPELGRQVDPSDFDSVEFLFEEKP